MLSPLRALTYISFTFLFACADEEPKIEEPVSPSVEMNENASDEPEPSEQPTPMPEPVPDSAPLDEFSDDEGAADLDSGEPTTGGAEVEAPSNSEKQGDGKGGIISSGVKKKKGPCSSFTDPKRRQRCLDREAQKP